MNQTKLFSIFLVIFSWCTHGAQNTQDFYIQEWEKDKASFKSSIEAHGMHECVWRLFYCINPLSQAVIHDDVQFALYLFDKKYPNPKTHYHNSIYEPLLFAAKSTTMVQCLLDNKADVNAQYTQDQSILQAFASRDHDPEVMQLYRRNGLGNIRDNDQSLFLLLHEQFKLSSTVIQKLVALMNAGVSLDARHGISGNTIVQDLKVRLRKTREKETTTFQDLQSILRVLEEQAKGRKQDIEEECMEVVKVPALANLILEYYEKEAFDQTEEEIDELIVLENPIS